MKRINLIFLVSPLILQTAIWPATRFLLWFFGHLKVYGLENLNSLPKNKGVIFASNHTSELDPILPPASLPFLSRFMPFFYTSRGKGLYKNIGARERLYGGSLFKFWGAHPVHSGLKDYERSLEDHISLLQQGCSVLVFPEGGISKNGILGEAKGGVAYLSERIGLPVVPIAFTGTYGITLADFFARKRSIAVRFGTPVFPDELLRSAEKVLPSMNNNIYKVRAQYVLQKIQNLIIQV